MINRGLMVTPLLRDKAPAAYKLALGSRSQAAANRVLVAFGFPAVVDPSLSAHKNQVIRARFDKPMDVGQYSLDICQGGSRYHTLGREAPNRTVNPDGKTSWLSSAVAICESQAPVRATKRAPKSYLRDRPVV